MVAKGTFYGAIAVLVALLILSSSLSVYYFFQYQSASQDSQTRAGELSAALASYSALAQRYNASLEDYNATLSLLSLAVANLNTSIPAYLTASHELSSLWASYQDLVKAGGGKPLAYQVHLLVDYGNGTRQWYNDTMVQPGWNGYVVSLVLLDGDLQATWYPQFGEHFVTGVNGVPGTSSESWFVWEYSGGAWSLASSGADLIQTHNGTAIAWTLCGYDSSFNPTCEPP